MLWLLMYVIALVFAALMQLVMQVFGAAGRLVGIVLLMLQVTSSAGTFPIETSAAFFRVLKPLMPMTYAVRGLRACISGRAMTAVVGNGFVLLAFAGGALALTTLAASRARVWTMARLHPELA
jgi:putative membrane protein